MYLCVYYGNNGYRALLSQADGCEEQRGWEALHNSYSSAIERHYAKIWFNSEDVGHINQIEWDLLYVTKFFMNFIAQV